jgi:hypothetical protein
VDLSGYHITDHRGHVGMQASASSIEHSSPMPLKLRDVWKYTESIPDRARIDRYFYSYRDLEQLCGWEKEEAQRKQRAHGWRSRFDPTTRVREYFLYDLLATSFAYMESWPGHNIDQELLLEAKDFIRARLSTQTRGQLYFSMLGHLYSWRNHSAHVSTGHCGEQAARKTTAVVRDTATVAYLK